MHVGWRRAPPHVCSLNGAADAFASCGVAISIQNRRPMADPKSSSDRFHPGMPTIPGVGNQRVASSGRAAGGLSARGLRAAILLGAVALLFVLIGLWIYAQRNRAKLQPGSQADAHDVLEDAGPPEPRQATPEVNSARTGPGQIARLDELSNPWSSLPFTYIRPDSHEQVTAIVVRLPGPAGSSGSYWAFSLVEPYGTCQLLYVTDLKNLASQFGFSARHPMVTDPCDGAVFDPLAMGALPDGRWARGAIVQGGALRPPLSIELNVRNNDLFADRIE
jgi:hypothetical protein